MVDKRFKNLEFKVGLFVFVALVLLFLILGTFAVQKQIFTKKVSIEIFADSGEGLSKSMPIMYSGFQIAKIYNVNLRDDGIVVMQAKIPKQYTKWVKKDSEVKLTSQGLIGSNSIVFSGGSNKGEIENGTTFALKRDKGLDALIAKGEAVLEDVQKIIKNVEAVSRTIAENKDNLQKVLVGVGDVGDDLHQKKGSLGYLVRTDHVKDEVADILTKVKQVEDNINNIALRITDIAEKLKTDLDETGDNTVEATKGVKDAIDKTQPILDDIKNISGNISKTSDNIENLKQDTEDALNTTNRILINLEAKWPFSSGKKIGEKVKMP